jgi:hypothetical protein
MADHGESLAWRASENTIDRAVSDSRRFSDGPGAQADHGTWNDGGIRKIILVNRAMDGVDFHGGCNIESGLLESQAQAPRARKKVYANWSHPNSLANFVHLTPIR